MWELDTQTSQNCESYTCKKCVSIDRGILHLLGRGGGYRAHVLKIDHVGQIFLCLELHCNFRFEFFCRKTDVLVYPHVTKNRL